MTAPAFAWAQSLGLPAASLQFLRGAQPHGDGPVRSVLFGAERFAEHGASLSSAQRVLAPARRPSPFFPRLDENIALWRDAIRVLRERGAVRGADPAQAWLLDNAMLIDVQFDQVRQDLPNRYFERLPRLADAPLTGLPRVYGVAWAWVAHADSTLEPSLMRRFLGAYQSTDMLALREMWALPASLRVVLVENLRRLAERTVLRQIARDAADQFAHGLADDTPDPTPTLHQIDAAWSARSGGDAFALQLSQHVSEGAGIDGRDRDSPAAHAVRAWLRERLPNPAAALDAEQAEGAADHQSIRNAIGTLRAIGALDWRTVFEDTHPVLRAMNRNPVFHAERADTQDRALHALEKLSETSRRSELEVADTVLALCENAAQTTAHAPDPPRASAPLHWLRGDGRAELLRTLGSRAPLGDALLDWGRRRVTPLYLATLSGATALLLWALVGPLDAVYQPFGSASQWVAVLLALLPASEVVVALVNRLISESSPPSALPRYAFADALPSHERTLVVVPCMLVRSVNVAALAAQLERHYLANRDDAVQYALLSDWADSPQQEAPTDKALLEQAIGLVEGLNERYPPPHAGSGTGTPVPRFLLLHRRRRFSQTEQAWIGWERKRGKLESLVARLAAVPDHADDFIDLGPLSAAQPWVRHLVTLDGDTALPPGALRELVAVAAHPLNRPRCEGRSVVQGHGVFQPRVAAPLPVRATTTAFHRMYAGEPGIDPYSATSSEIYQDLWDEGSYTGKGLIDVQAAARVLVGRLPEDIVLSHDLIEGSMLRSAMVSDIAVVEEAPMHHDVANARLHRWARGDWQLMPFLAHPRRYGLTGMHLWKMFDNLRRSLVTPAALVLLVASFAGFGLTPGWALLLVCATFGAGPLLGAVAAFAPSRDAISMRRFYRHAAGHLAYTIGGVLWHLLQLLGNAVLYVDAAARALWRQAVSKRHLMQWTTMAATERAATTDWRVLLVKHRAVPLTAGAILLGLGALRLQGVAIAWGVALPLLFCWALSPLAIGPVSTPRTLPRREQVGPLDRGYLAEISRDIWQWYERWVTAEDHHLPPDNVQHDPDQVIASRTSPTNIGLYLLAVCCARRLGYIDDAAVTERLSLTLATLDRLPRYRGHFFNWIDTRSLVVLAPPYVSTVDSGNLCAHLRVTAAACDLFAVAPGVAQPEPLHALAQRMRAMADAHDFTFLYDAPRKLLHIGLRADTEQLDQTHYDLLASEARLASLVGIAKGDLPARHWGALGRPYFSRGEVTGLKSWSGSMFEMLMPTLVLDEPPGSVLFEAAQACVIEHQRAARKMGDGQAPWGVSESAHNARDHTLAYQYGPQGVAALALRETPASEHVIAPYATLMAAMICPGEAADNLRALEALGARNHGGFIEALDFSPARVPDGKRFMPVGTWMSHHQGMAFVALTDVLADGAPRQWAAADPQLAACRWLLHERAPHEVPPLVEPEVSEAAPHAPAERFVALLDSPQHGTLPATLWLGNGRHGVMLREYGSGVSQWGDRLVSRWRDDLPQDLHGHFFWLRDLQPGDAPSRWLTLSARPAPGLLWRYHTRFRPDAAEFDAEGDGLRCRTEVWVAAEDDVELRRVTIVNRSPRSRVLSLVSAFEVTLAPAKSDEAHPAFSNLFIAASWDAHARALHLSRKPRTEHEKPTHALHALVSIQAERGASVAPPLAMADRAQWLGRGGRPARPVGALAQARIERRLRDSLAASGERPTGMDPMAWLQTNVTLPPGAQVELTFATAVAPERPSLDFLLDRLAQPALRKRTLSMAQTMATIRLHGTGLDARTWAAGLWLNTLLSGLCTREGVAALPLFERDLLWRHGISGDAPIVLVRVADAAGLPLLRSLTALLDAMPAGPTVDVVVLDAEPASYYAPVERALHALAERARHGTRCRMHILRESTVEAPTRDALQAIARVRCVADGRPLATVLQREMAAHREAGQARERVGSTPVRLEADAGTLSLAPALIDDAPHAAETALRSPEGRFDVADGAFRFHVDEHTRPARAWVNVIANADFGTQVSEAGAGMTWAGNSRLHAITPWSNDALLDPPGEGLLLHDLDSGSAWLLGRGLAREVVHAPGLTAMRFELPRLSVRICWTVDAQQAVKQCQVEFSAAPGRARRLRLLAFAMWQLGLDAGARQVIDTSVDEAGPGALPTPVLYGTQPDTLNGFGGATAWLALRPTASGDKAFGWPAFEPLADGSAVPTGEIAPRPWRADVELSADRRLLFDVAGRFVMPHALDGRSGAGLDPAALLAVPLLLQPGQALACSVLLGHAPNLGAARDAARTAWAVDPAARLAGQRAVWARLSSAAQVSTPDPLFDALVNHWLPAQTLGCRLWARAGFYQAGGAFGFRDQLQDAMALVAHDPALLAAQIRRHAARQFVEGDVQHWWHEPGGAGVRTRFADDRLWLAVALALYVQRSGDASLLDESAPFLSGRAVPPEVEDLYESPAVSAERASLYEHAARAIDISLASGQHGLPLFGTGDWNDGMNRVGHQGRGESVWMGWFLASVIDALLPHAKARADMRRVAAWQARRRELVAVLDREAWDGAWYLRGWFDDGTPLGTHAATECRIDLIAQAWAVLTGAGDAQRARTALDSAWTHLHEPRLKLARLLAPPLQHHQPPAGYIQGYPPGVRENGGQYNHGAVWALMAFAKLGDAQRAWTLFEGISPAHRDADPALREAYAIEPYAVAGDVYADAPSAGRGGWSWYTGSAGWLLRAALESICGVRVEGGPQGRLHLLPCLPAHWPRAAVRLRVGERTIDVQIERETGRESDAGLLEPGAQVALAGLPLHAVLRVRAAARGVVLHPHEAQADRAARSERRN